MEKDFFKTKIEGFAEAMKLSEAISEKKLEIDNYFDISMNESSQCFPILSDHSDGFAFFAEKGKKSCARISIDMDLPGKFTTYFVFEEGSKCEILLENQISASSQEYRCIEAARGADAKICTLQKNGKDCTCESKTYAKLGKKTSLSILECNLGGNERIDETQIVQNEARSRCNYYEASIPHAKQRFTKKFKNLQAAPETYFRAVFKYTPFGSSSVNLTGNVVIEKGAAKSDAHFLVKSLLFSDNTRQKIIPMLCVREEDCRAEHGALFEPVSENELFYLSSRGISEKQGSMMIAKGFFYEDLKKSGCKTYEKEIADELSEALTKAFQSQEEAV